MSVCSFSTAPLIDRIDFYFNPPPAGEPSPSAYYDGMNPRERVLKNACKVVECWLTVMSWIRPMIGNRCTAQYEEESQYEQLIIHRRDMLNKAQKTLDYLLELDNALKGAYTLAEVTKATVMELERPLRLQQTDHEKCEAILQKFLAQSLADTLSTFAVHNYLRMCNQCDEYFLYGTFQPDDSDDFNEQKLRAFIINLYEDTARLHLHKSWNILTLSEKRWALESMSLMTCAKLFDFKQSAWNFHKNVTHLINELSTHGPLMVQGHFGQLFYKEKPFILSDRIAQRTIWGWQAGAARQENMEYQFHPILIVGARSDLNDGYVYFMDAMDASDPDDSDSAKVYVISYPKFKNTIVTLEGMKVNLESISSKATNFAWHGGPFKGYI